MCYNREVIGREISVEEIFGRVLGDTSIEGEVCPEAEAFVCVGLAAAGAKCWFVCKDVRAQESLGGEMVLWLPSTRVFPEISDLGSECIPDPESAAERLDILASLAQSCGRQKKQPLPIANKQQRSSSCPCGSTPLILHAGQLDEEVPEPKSLDASSRNVQTGERLDMGALIAWLEAGSYEQAAVTVVRGQFALRGGIVDVFSWQSLSPVRIEFFDDTVESLREFDPDSQVSTGSIQAVRLVALAKKQKFVKLSTLAPAEELIYRLERRHSGVATAQPLEGENNFAADEFQAVPYGEMGAGDLTMDAVRCEGFFRQLEEWRLGKWVVILAAASDAEAARFREFAAERGRNAGWVRHLALPLSQSFLHIVSRTVILSDAAIFGRAAFLRARRVGARHFRSSAVRAAADFSQFEEGELVVHLDHGIGRYEGLVASPDGDDSEVLSIRYANNARLYVPVPQAWQISRYAGLGKASPALSDLGSEKWSRAKQKTLDSVFDYAARMLRVQAERQSLDGHACSLDTHWQEEFEAEFPYKETPDQIRAIAETKRDMEATRPMERLVCGDVGFGKTEVAIRAAFKTVMDGRQAAILAPTTVLAQQHYQTLRERFSDFPVTVHILNRYCSPADQRKTIVGLADGSVDVVVGTHRLISPDVNFKNLGLMVVDEEQRFGVQHKEVLKEKFRQVDIMTLSATPIPRTLYMAMVGTRDMSLIETPPPGRQSVETIVCAYDERVWRDAIIREIARGGQVYFLHNRIGTIESVALRIQELCPAARVVVGHGRMIEGELDEVMRSFVARRADVLVSTTIIESGLDIPNANTIIIDRADRFGLADLYQLRGRVGRSGAKAYAYLMLPRDLMGAARRRVSAIKQYSGLGSGFKIAMRDLELRGAGNLLGTAQSGHILAVGFDLYCRMLKRAVDSLAGKTHFTRYECAVHLDFVRTEEWVSEKIAVQEMASAFLPASYISEAQLRIACYRQLAEAETAEGIETVRQQWRDRFGPLPTTVENLLTLTLISIEGSKRRITSVEVQHGNQLVLSRRKTLLQKDGKFPRIEATDPTAKLYEIVKMICAF